jgi:hypothetical protein
MRLRGSFARYGLVFSERTCSKRWIENTPDWWIPPSVDNVPKIIPTRSWESGDRDHHSRPCVTCNAPWDLVHVHRPLPGSLPRSIEEDKGQLIIFSCEKLTENTKFLVPCLIQKMNPNPYIFICSYSSFLCRKSWESITKRARGEVPFSDSRKRQEETRLQ